MGPFQIRQINSVPLPPLPQPPSGNQSPLFEEAGPLDRQPEMFCLSAQGVLPIDQPEKKKSSLSECRYQSECTLAPRGKLPPPRRHAPPIDNSPHYVMNDANARGSKREMASKSNDLFTRSCRLTSVVSRLPVRIWQPGGARSKSCRRQPGGLSRSPAAPRSPPCSRWRRQCGALRTSGKQR